MKDEQIKARGKAKALAASVWLEFGQKNVVYTRTKRAQRNLDRKIAAIKAEYEPVDRDRGEKV
jgi:hypothetical protein